MRVTKSDNTTGLSPGEQHSWCRCSSACYECHTEYRVFSLTSRISLKPGRVDSNQSALWDILWMCASASVSFHLVMCVYFENKQEKPSATTDNQNQYFIFVNGSSISYFRLSGFNFITGIWFLQILNWIFWFNFLTKKLEEIEAQDLEKWSGITF